VRPALVALAILAGVPAVLALAILALGAAATLLITLRVGAAYPPGGPFVAVPGGRLATLQEGPAEGARATVVLIHGASANAADPMAGIGASLAARGFRVIAFDRPGLGWSDRIGGDAAADPAVQARSIAEGLRALGAPPALVLGHSWGSALALALALDHPDRVAGLALVSPVALPFPQRISLPWYWRLAAKPPVAWLLSRTIGPPLALYYLRGAAGQAFRPQAETEGYLERARAPLVIRPGALLANLQDLIGLPAALARMSPRYASLSVPTVIVSGDADPLVRPEAQAQPLARAIPGATLVLLPGIGHMVPWVAPEALADAVTGLAARAAD
jgi:pimeloyl-ACP methyl ester carboxylesterase